MIWITIFRQIISVNFNPIISAQIWISDWLHAFIGHAALDTSKADIQKVLFQIQPSFWFWQIILTEFQTEPLVA